MDTETVEVHKMITYFEAMLPTVINFAIKVVLALLVYFICSKIIKKLCKVLRAQPGSLPYGPSPRHPEPQILSRSDSA